MVETAANGASLLRPTNQGAARKAAGRHRPSLASSGSRSKRRRKRPTLTDLEARVDHGTPSFRPHDDHDRHVEGEPVRRCWSFDGFLLLSRPGRPDCRAARPAKRPPATRVLRQITTAGVHMADVMPASLDKVNWASVRPTLTADHRPARLVKQNKDGRSAILIHAHRRKDRRATIRTTAGKPPRPIGMVNDYLEADSSTTTTYEEFRPSAGDITWEDDRRFYGDPFHKMVIHDHRLQTRQCAFTYGAS